VHSLSVVYLVLSAQSVAPSVFAAAGMDKKEFSSRDDEPLRGSQTDRVVSAFSLVLVFLACIGGFLFGYDTGIISGSIVLIADDFDLR